MDKKEDKQPNRMPKIPKLPQKMPKSSPVLWLLIALLLFSLFMGRDSFVPKDEIQYGELVKYIDQGYIESAYYRDSYVIGKFSDAGIAARTIDGKKTAPEFKTTIRSEVIEDLTARFLKKGIKVEFKAGSIWMPLLLNILPFLLIIAVFWFVIGRGMKGGGPGGMLMNIGRSKHRVRGKGAKKITFDDVAGIEEAKEEVTETIEFLKNPKRFLKIGGRIPRGILLEGPPGCGKTLLAKAIAGQADVPFFDISGSDFVEMFVGVGASRVRDLFRQAKENAPCIIFLDEIDAIGKKRGPGAATGGHDEREQTLNAILVEMDGFGTSDQVIVVAATNRVDVLDQALTRPGRFDRQIYVPLPDIKGRHEILKVHSKKVKMSPDVDLEKIARGTPMFSGAELEALINEAAIGATMANKDFIEHSDLEEARDKVRWGRAKKSRHLDKNEKEVTAYHEAGHTLIQSMLEDADPLHKVSIIPRGPMGGATFSLPEKDRTLYTKKFCMAYLQVCYGGRIAEEIFCGDISSGAQGDIKQATSMARTMVLEWGMSDEIGMVNFSADPARSGFLLPSSPDYSEETAQHIDREIKRLIDDAYDKAKELILKHRDDVERIAKALLKYETLDADEVEALLAGKELTKPTVADLLEVEKNKQQMQVESLPQEEQAQEESDEPMQQEDLPEDEAGQEPQKDD